MSFVYLPIIKNYTHMRTILLALALVFSIPHSYSQTGKPETEKPAYKKVADKFEGLYNRGSYDSVFAMYSADMKKALPLDQNREFLESVKVKAGAIKKREFKKYLRTYAMYKTTFEREVFALKISLDAAGKINGVLVNPYGD
jgi:Protein of unknown function (DUF3887)